MPRKQKQSINFTKYIPVVAIALIILGGAFLISTATPNQFTGFGEGDDIGTVPDMTDPDAVATGGGGGGGDDDDDQVWTWEDDDGVIHTSTVPVDDEGNPITTTSATEPPVEELNGYVDFQFYGTFEDDSGLVSTYGIGAEDPALGSMFTRGGVKLLDLHAKPQIFLSSEESMDLVLTVNTTVGNAHYRVNHVNGLPGPWYSFQANYDHYWPNDDDDSNAAAVGLITFPLSHKESHGYVSTNSFVNWLDLVSLKDDIGVIFQDLLDHAVFFTPIVTDFAGFDFSVSFSGNIRLTGTVDGESHFFQSGWSNAEWVQFQYQANPEFDPEDPWVQPPPGGGGGDPGVVVAPDYEDPGLTTASVGGGWSSPLSVAAPYVIGTGIVVLIIGLMTNMIALPKLPKRKTNRTPQRRRRRY